MFRFYENQSFWMIPLFMSWAVLYASYAAYRLTNNGRKYVKQQHKPPTPVNAVRIVPPTTLNTTINIQESIQAASKAIPFFTWPFMIWPAPGIISEMIPDTIGFFGAAATAGATGETGAAGGTGAAGAAGGTGAAGVAGAPSGVLGSTITFTSIIDRQNRLSTSPVARLFQ